MRSANQRDVYGAARDSAALAMPHGFVEGLGHATDPTAYVLRVAQPPTPSPSSAR